MKWFVGSIAEAVAASKAKKAVFVVFVEGKDDASKEVAKTLDATEVSTRLDSEKFVVIKLQSDTENYTFFAQIYQLVPVPSIFFIGENGTPLEIVGNPLSPSDLAAKIDSILIKAAPQANSSTNLINAETAHSSGNSQEPNKSESSDLSETPKDSSSNNEEVNLEGLTAEERAAYELSQEEKVRRARELIEVQNKKRADEEERKEREREIERRKMGKDVQKLRQQQQEKEIKDAHRERMREKAAEAAAREKILKQIAEDKLERKRKYDMQNQEKTAAQQQKKAQEEAQARAKAAASVDNSKARIQFKMPTGNSITGTFESSSTLGQLRTYVRENAQLPYQQFGMSSFFPRRDFTSADDSKNLIDLDLVPSAVILILPVKSSNPASVIKSTDGAGIFSHFLWTLLAPVVSIYNYIMGYFSGRPRGDASDNSNENRNSDSTLGDNASAAFGRVANMATRRLGGNQGVSKIRARGNIHTLHSGDNDNDENNTWNGNSTQQM